MKTLLVFPPASDPAHPPLGIASLAGYLRDKGQDVTLLDLNISAYHHFLSGGEHRAVSYAFSKTSGNPCFLFIPLWMLSFLTKERNRYFSSSARSRPAAT